MTETALKAVPEVSRETSLADALVAVQANMPKIGRDNTGKIQLKTGGSYSYKYADLADVTDKLYPILTANGLAFTAIPTLNNDGRFVLRYRLLHISGEDLTGEYPLPDPSHTEVKQIGSAITYARRYCLTAVVGCVPDEDDDGTQAPTTAKPVVQTVDLSHLTKDLPQEDRKALKAMWDANYEFGPSVVPKNLEAAVTKMIADYIADQETDLAVMRAKDDDPNYNPMEDDPF